MHKVYINGKSVTLTQKDVIGKGGEADVYSIGGGLALKLFKQPDHPDLQVTDPVERQALRAAASARIATHQRKLRLFPNRVPAGVLAPQELAYDSGGPGASIVGYTMPYLDGAEMLFQYGRRQFREQAAQSGFTNDRMCTVLADLHRLVSTLHSADVVIGDFNDLNVLVKGEKAYLVDSDSFQYGGFLCNTFQYRFVDPLLCNPALDHPELQRPHNENSDWYAFSAMAMRCLLFVEPYGGIHRPPDASKRVPDSARALHRISIFNGDVQYPRPALPLQILPDDLLHYFQATYEQDARGPFPLDLLNDLRWTRCMQCGTHHARPTCPFCYRSLPSAQPKLQITGASVSCIRIFHTDGTILEACVASGNLCWLFHEGDAVRREDGSVVVRGHLAQGMKVGLGARATYLGKDGTLVKLEPGEPAQKWPVDTVESQGMFATNSRHVYWGEGGHLYRDGAVGPYLIGDIMTHQTRFWVGESFGFGFYSAGGLSGALVFDAERAGINDNVPLTLPTGQILDADCLFGTDRCWLLLSIQEKRSIVNYCFVILRDGTVAAVHSAGEGDGSWLGTINGKCAAGNGLFAATDQGIARIEQQGNFLAQTRLFSATEPYVTSGSKLLAGRDGIYLVTATEINLLALS